MASGHTNRATFVVVSDSNAVRIGTNVISRHRSHAAATRFARKFGGTVEVAEVVALVRGGMSATDALQKVGRDCTSGVGPVRPYRSVEV